MVTDPEPSRRPPSSLLCALSSKLYALGRSVTGTYEILVIPKVVAEGARGEFHNFRDVPKITLTPIHCLVLDCPTDPQALEGSTVEGFSICWSPVEEVKLSKYKT